MLTSKVHFGKKWNDRIDVERAVCVNKLPDEELLHEVPTRTRLWIE